jgi:hypothetical protein
MNRTDAALGSYLEEIAQIRLLTTDQEIKLGHRFRKETQLHAIK